MGTAITINEVDMFGLPASSLHDEDSGSDGGSLTQDTWSDCALDQGDLLIEGASLSSNNVTLPAGTYHIVASAPTFKCVDTQIRLYDGSTTLLASGDVYCTSSSNFTRSADCVLEGVVTLASEKTLQLQIRCTTTRADDGRGQAASMGTEIYAQILIQTI